MAPAGFDQPDDHGLTVEHAAPGDRSRCGIGLRTTPHAQAWRALASLSAPRPERPPGHAACLCGCGREYNRIVIFATSDGDADALVSVACHGHPDDEVWLDVTFGSWDEANYSNHVTFSCRVSEAGAGLVDALVASAGRAEHYGRLLTREQALLEPDIVRLWTLVDQVVTEVPEVAACVYPDGFQ